LVTKLPASQTFVCDREASILLYYTTIGPKARKSIYGRVGWGQGWAGIAIKELF
tara:strand:+ start:884 stop:1045 length:162 start_codon:yes stop_codon:yes gene_type:complete